MEPKARPAAGFILVELIVSMVLLGIIGVFTSLFLYTGIKGYLIAKQTNEGAMKAQIALDRINLELRKISALPALPEENRSITYNSEDLPGTRKIGYNDADPDNRSIYLEIDGTRYVLLDRLAAFRLSLDEEDLNNDGNDEIAGIDIGFTFTDFGTPFDIRIYPRNWLPAPP